MRLSIEVSQTCPRPGWAELNPNVLLSTVVECIDEVCRQLPASGYSVAQVEGVGITNHRGWPPLHSRQCFECRVDCHVGRENGCVFSRLRRLVGCAHRRLGTPVY
jgi:hypothetical protein